MIKKKAITPTQEESKELELVKSETKGAVIEAEVIEIASKEDMKRAAEMLSRFNQWNDRVVADRETLTKPLNGLLKNIRERYAPVEKTLKSVIDSLRMKIGAYQTEETRKVREEEAKIAARVREGKGGLKIETAVKKMEAIEKPDDRVDGEEGAVSFREDKKLKITNIMAIPDAYWDVNEKRVLDDIKAGKVVPGATIELIQVPINRRG